MSKNQSFQVPMTVEADAYTISGQGIISDEAKQRSVYYMVNRTSPMKAWPEVAKDDRMVFFGLSHYIIENLTRRITDKDVLETKMFMEQAHFGGAPMFYDYRLMKRVVDEYDGYLPIIIEGLPEGDTFYPHQPMVQVTSLGEGFGELAAHVEACLLGDVSLGTARATLTAHLWLHLVEKAEHYGCDVADVDNFIHDFGMRAGIKEESMVLGLAHLLFFNGTDTFNAAFKAWRDGVTTAGKSIMALAHRVVQGFVEEGDCYKNLYEKAPVGSYVADCYDFKNAVSKYLVPLAAQKKNVVVARPDSGDALKNDKFVREQAKQNGLCKHGEKYLEPTFLCSIEGNSVKPPVIDEMLEARHKAGFHPFKTGIFGLGGYLRNNLTRDSLSSKYALNAVGLRNRPVMKFSEVQEKETIPGPLELWDGRCSLVDTHSDAMYDVIPSHVKQRLVTYYHGGKLAPFVGNFKPVHARAKETFKNAKPFMKREDIVANLVPTINRLRAKYKGN